MAIDEIYLKILRNRSTNTIQLNVAQILTYLFDGWGIVNDEELQAKESECREMVYDLIESIVQIFDELEEIQDFGEATQNDDSDMQSIKFALQIIKNTGKFEHDM